MLKNYVAFQNYKTHATMVLHELIMQLIHDGGLQMFLDSKELNVGNLGV